VPAAGQRLYVRPAEIVRRSSDSSPGGMEEYNEKIRHRQIKRQHVDMAQNLLLFIADFHNGSQPRLAAVVEVCDKHGYVCMEHDELKAG